MSSNNQIWVRCPENNVQYSPPLSMASIIMRHAPGQVLEPGSPPSEAREAL
jgi:hypothetical protein